MRHTQLIISIWLTGSLAALSASEHPRLSTFSLPELEQRLTEIDTELEQLAHYSLRSGIGAIGYRSMLHKSPDETEWVEIELERETPLDEIVLVPTIRRNPAENFLADGFPETVRIIVGTATDRTGVLLGEYHYSRQFLGIAPVIIPLNQINASWVRIEASQLAPLVHTTKNRYIFQLSEIMLFSGEENVALRRPVMNLSTHQADVPEWDKRFLVDGHTPYLMDSIKDIQGSGYLSPQAQHQSITLDLGERFPISRIHLHQLSLIDMVPKGRSDGLGIPGHILVEGAARPDFSDAIPLLNCKIQRPYDIGPILMWNFPETVCRYVRLTTLKPTSKKFRMGFAEIELFSKGKNVALEKALIPDQEPQIPGWSFTSLTDGYNFYGRILPTREWMNELAQRHALETEHPIIRQELTLRYAHQKKMLARMSWLAALLTAATGLAILIGRMIHRRQIDQMRNQLAADLHDELGANIHVIGLLGDLAQNATHSPEKLKQLHQRIRTMTERSGIAVRECTNMLEANLYGDLLEDMQRSNQRIMADIQGALTCQGEAQLNNLSPRTRADLFLFYKECLINICRHAQASQFSAQLTATPKEILLTVTDNGQGTENLKAKPPASLARRARLLKANLSVERPEKGGTRITLRMQTRRGLRRRKLET